MELIRAFFCCIVAVLSFNSYALKEPLAEISVARALEALVLEPIKTDCLYFPNKESSASRKNSWWKYRWCPFEGTFYQYHEEKGVRNVEHSLGVSSGDAQLRFPEDLHSHKTLKEISLNYEYENGQRCDEIASPRRTLVEVRCCSSQASYRRSRFAVPFIKAIREIQTCEYHVTVCSTDLCVLARNVSGLGSFKHKSENNLLTEQEIIDLRDEVKEMFYNAYQGYMTYAFPSDQLKPISCRGEYFELTAGSMLTLIDAMDTLVILGNYTEFRRAVQLVSERADFCQNKTVSVFETTIRILGGLISSHLFAEELFSDYDGALLLHAVDLADRLMPAFDTSTSIPYGTVNLLSGVPKGETTEACTAAAGSLSLEFGVLSALTNNATYGLAARASLKALYDLRSKLGLLGRHIDVMSGTWTEPVGGIGSNIDSIYEYFLKHYILFGDEKAWEMFIDLYMNALKYLRHDNTWYAETNIHVGGVTRKLFNNLQAFWPGMQSLLGDFEASTRTLNAFFAVWNKFGFTPEDFSYEKWDALSGGSKASYPLRPELAESTFYMHEATGDHTWLLAGRDILRSLQACKSNCGYAAIADVKSKRLKDTMPSFFLSESCKYLYLLFDIDHPMRASNGGKFIFTTEAHPIETSWLYQKKAAELGYAISGSRISRPKKVEQTAGESLLWGVPSLSEEMLIDKQCPAMNMKPWNLTSIEKYYRSFTTDKSFVRKLRFRSNDKVTGHEQQRIERKADGSFKLSSSDPELPSDFEIAPLDGGLLIAETGTKNMVQISRLGLVHLTAFVQHETSLVLYPTQNLIPFCTALEAKANLLRSELETTFITSEGEHYYLFFPETVGSFAYQCTLEFYPMNDVMCMNEDMPKFLFKGWKGMSLPFEIPCAFSLYGPSAFSLDTSSFSVVDLQSNSSFSYGCSPEAFKGVQLNDKFVLINRGNCAFEEKTLYAQKAGAKGVIIVQNNLAPLFLMSGLETRENQNGFVDFCPFVNPLIPLEKKSDQSLGKIPTFMISLRDGARIRSFLQETDNIGFSVHMRETSNESRQREPWAVVNHDKLVIMSGSGWGVHLSAEMNQWQLFVLSDKRKD